MTSIIKTSKLLNYLYDNLDADDDETIDYDTFMKNEFLTHIDTYVNGRLSQSITQTEIEQFIQKFEMINLHSCFIKPSLEEYFNPKLCNLLLLDFLISMSKLGLISELKNINSSSILPFFMKLSHLYNFMNYLDIDNKFLDYLKYMLVLYLQTQNKNIMDTNFGHISWDLDQFFKYEVIKPLYYKFNVNLTSNNSIINDYKNKYYPDIMKEYDDTKDYCQDTEYLDKYFIVLVEGHIAKQIINDDKMYVDNPDEPKFDGQDDYGKYIIGKKRELDFKRSIKYFNKDAKLFVMKTYQRASNLISKFNLFIKSLDIGIHRLDNLTTFDSKNEITPHVYSCVKMDMLTFMGIKVDNYPKDYLTHYFGIACEMQHIDIIKHIVINEKYMESLFFKYFIIYNLEFYSKNVFGSSEIYNFLSLYKNK